MIVSEMTCKVCKWDVKPYSSHLCMYVSVGVIQLHVSTWESALRTTISSTVTVVQLGTPAQCAMSVSVALSLSTTRLAVWSGWVLVWGSSPRAPCQLEMTNWETKSHLCQSSPGRPKTSVFRSYQGLEEGN